jgi:hypothetical protein
MRKNDMRHFGKIKCPLFWVSQEIRKDDTWHFKK